MEKKELFSALIKAQVELKNPPKTSTAKIKTKSGAEFSYSYAELPAIIDMTKPILAKYGLAIVQTLVGDGEKVGIKTLLIHESGQVIGNQPEDILYLPKSDIQGNSTQAMGASITYGRRYSLCAMLGVSADDDTDASDDIEKKESTTPDPARFTAPKTNGFKKPEFVTSTGGSTGTYPNPNIPSNTPVVHIAPVPQTVVPTQVTPVTTQAVAPVATVPTVAPSAPVATAAPRPSFATPKRPTFAKPNFKSHIENLNKGGQ